MLLLLLLLMLLLCFTTCQKFAGCFASICVLYRYERSRMKAKDRRIRSMYEILNSIRVIKCNAWEETFADNVDKVRSEELGFLRRKYTLTSFSNFVFGSVPILITLSSFGTYVATGDDHVLTADKVKLGY